MQLVLGRGNLGAGVGSTAPQSCEVERQSVPGIAIFDFSASSQGVIGDGVAVWLSRHLGKRLATSACSFC
ncbi:MAG: hypothetical protein CMM01_01505 [Rhodopirellula sp.]|nr:hypothetical protein [Rhodopirellula sp.]